MTAEITQSFAVFVHLHGAFVEVKVADHVDHHETEQTNARDCHGVLLADRRLVDVQWPRKLPRSPMDGANLVSSLGVMLWRGGLRHECCFLVA